MFLQLNIELSEINAFLPVYFQYLILFAGVIVTSLLLWYEIDSNNPLLHKVCTGIVKGNCDAILSGKQSKLFSWLSWSEIGFFYFAGGLLTLLLYLPLNKQHKQYSLQLLYYNFLNNKENETSKNEP